MHGLVTGRAQGLSRIYTGSDVIGSFMGTTVGKKAYTDCLFVLKLWRKLILLLCAEYLHSKYLILYYEKKNLYIKKKIKAYERVKMSKLRKCIFGR